MGTLGWIFSSQRVVHSKMCRDTGMMIAQQKAQWASGDVLSCASDMLMCDAPCSWLILMLLWWIAFVFRGAASAQNKESHGSDFGSWGAVFPLELTCLLWSLLWRINKTVAWIELLNPDCSRGFEIRAVLIKNERLFTALSYSLTQLKVTRRETNQNLSLSLEV